ncbi:hypothetical protein Golomagni_07699, partial [Golovinomyces magnicellulatus]
IGAIFIPRPIGMDQDANYALFRDCLSTALLRPDATGTEPKRRRRAKSTSMPLTNDSSASEKDIEELSEFIEYLATEVFDALPVELQEVDYRAWRDSEWLQEQFALPLAPDSLDTLNFSPSLSETLITYNLVSKDPTLPSSLPPTTEAFLAPAVASYLNTLTTPPPASSTTRASECEICGRSWIPLSYHHLIPRFVHEKVVKRGWHKKEDLQNVAWLCGACHRFVHTFRNHEELARDFYTVELLLENEKVQQWAAWASTLRWKGGNSRRRH